jgi:hypothetical protein
MCAAKHGGVAAPIWGWEQLFMRLLGIFFWLAVSFLWALLIVSSLEQGLHYVHGTIFVYLASISSLHEK